MYNIVNDHVVALKLLNKTGDMPSLERPEDESIRTLYVGGLDARVSKQDLRENFYSHGEIKSVKMGRPQAPRIDGEGASDEARHGEVEIAKLSGSAELEKRTHKLKRLDQSPDSFFMVT
ncbi:zinc finger CCCH domain-containing protein 40-like protein [Tanacetum coccineum]